MKTAVIDVQNLIDQIVNLKIGLKETQKQLDEANERAIRYLGVANDIMDERAKLRSENKAFLDRIAELENQLQSLKN